MTSSNGNIFPRYATIVRGIHRSLVNSPHKGQWRGAVMPSLIFARINAWVKNSDSHSTAAEFVDTIYAYTNLPLINRFNWVTQSLVTLIDTKVADAFENRCHGILDISGYLVVCRIGDIVIRNELMRMSVCIRSFTKRNEISFQRELDEIDWSEIYKQSDTRGVFFSKFHIKCFKTVGDANFQSS